MQIIISLVISFVITLGLSILVHELGHFLFAKLFGISVETFSIGFGKKLWKKKYGETIYALSIFPFGGYVKMRLIPFLDEQDKEINPSADERFKSTIGKNTDENTTTDHSKALFDAAYSDLASLYPKSYFKKILIISAGCIFNILFGVIVLTSALLIGFNDYYNVPIIDTVEAGSPADTGGLKQGDKIININGKKIEYFEEIYSELNKSKDLNFIVERNGKKTTLTIIPSRFKTPEGEEKISFGAQPRIEPIIHDVIPNYPAQQAGLKSGDRIIAINDKPITLWKEMTDIINKSLDKELIITVQRGNTTSTKLITPIAGFDEDTANKGLIGIFPGAPIKKFVRLSPTEAFKSATDTCLSVGIETYRMLFKLITFQLPKNAIEKGMGGPTQIVMLSYDQTKKGLFAYLSFLAIINFLLGFFNLLPLPIADGGLICFVTIEKLLRKPFPKKAFTAIYVGTVYVLIFVFVLVTFNDIAQNLWRFGFK